MSVKPINLEKLVDKTEGVYEAVVITSKRARQIHQDAKIELNQHLETLAQLMTTPELEEEVDVRANPDQLKISLVFEKRPKPTELAIKEMLEKKIEWRYKEPETAESEQSDTE